MKKKRIDLCEEGKEEYNRCGLASVWKKKARQGKLKEIEKLKPKIVEILKKNGIRRAGIFGSYARGEQKKDSDINILIEVKEGVKFSLLDLIGLEMELKKRLKEKVDLLTYNGISSYLKDGILEEEVKII